MPYELKEQDGKWCVFNKDTGDNKGCSSSRDEAVKHMRLLYGVENGSIKKELLDSMIINDDVQPCACDSCIANDLELDDNVVTKEAWTSSYISALPDSSFAYIEPGCNDKGCRHFPIKDSSGSYDAAHVRNALARLSQSPFGDKAKAKVEAGARSLGIGQKKKGLIDYIKAIPIGRTFTTIPTEGTEDFSYFKQSDGRVRVFMRMSNMFKDRHGEIITSSAHKEYEAYVNRSGDYPVFKLWHVPASRWGQADLVSFDDGFLTVSGLADVGKEYIAESLSKQKDIGVSHGFRGISIQGKGYIDWYRTFEASPLPRAEAANVWTAYMIAKNWKDSMGLADKHKTWFANLGVPAEVISQWDNSNKEIGDLLKESGIDYKEFNEAVDGVKQSAAMHRAMAAFHTQAAAMGNPGDAEDKTEAPEKPGEKPDAEDKKEGKEKSVGDYAELSSKIDSLVTVVGGLVESHKALDSKLKDAVGDTLAATIVPGKGFVASKEGPAPSESQKKESDEWLLDLITGAK